MAIKEIKNTNNARRQMSVLSFKYDKVNENKNLIKGKRRISGRGDGGKVSVRNRGGGSKRRLRFVDNSRNMLISNKTKVIAINYDPNRTANIALLETSNNDKVYIIAPENIKKGSEIVCDDKAPIRIGNRLKLKNIPASTLIHDVELIPHNGGKIARSAGTYAILLGVDEKYAQLKLLSGEIRRVSKECFATIGVVSNKDHSNIKIGKAGRVRWMGKRPKVRGKAKNPCDHPHGGGEGGSPIGLTHPKTPWGMPALGRKTRNRNKKSNKLIIKR